jgi:L-fuconolactonase
MLKSEFMTATKIDTHQHFWRYNPRDYVWMTSDMDKLRKDYLPSDLFPIMSAAGVGGSIAIQARQSLGENTWLLRLADDHPFIRAVVGWVDLGSERVVEQLERFAEHPKFRGVRHVVHDELDDEFMLRKSFLNGLNQLKRFGLTYDLLLFPRHLPVASEMVRQFPDQLFVLDHIAKPSVRTGETEPWATDLKQLAQYPNVACKVSGLVTEAAWDSWKGEDFRPYLDIVLNAFGARRLMIGSDWPVCTLAADYQSVVNIEAEYIAELSSDEQHAIWSRNPTDFYGIPS